MRLVSGVVDREQAGLDVRFLLLHRHGKTPAGPSRVWALVHLQESHFMCSVDIGQRHLHHSHTGQRGTHHAAGETGPAPPAVKTPPPHTHNRHLLTSAVSFSDALVS